MQSDCSSGADINNEAIRPTAIIAVLLVCSFRVKQKRLDMRVFELVVAVIDGRNEGLKKRHDLGRTERKRQLKESRNDERKGRI